MSTPGDRWLAGMPGRGLRLAVVLVLAGLTAPAPATARTSVSSFERGGCPVSFKSERANPLGRTGHRLVTQAIGHSVYRVGIANVRIGAGFDWRALSDARLARKLSSLEFLVPLGAAVDGSASNPSYALGGREQKLALRRMVAVVSSFSRAANRGRVRAGHADRLRVVALRVPMLAFVARAAACRGLLGEAAARSIRRTLSRDLARLRRGPSSSGPANHRLTIAVGRLLAGYYLPRQQSAIRMARTARKEFRRHLLKGYDRREGTWLEHSPEYHRLAYSIIESFRRNIDASDPLINEAAGRLQHSLGALVLPDHSLVQWGDTTSRRYGLESVRKSPGRFLGWYPAARTGFVTHSDKRGGWFGLTSQYHSRAHKHHDEGSFDLWVRGTPVVQDAGRWGPGRYRGVQRSAGSHSTMVVDGKPFSTALHDEPYGSSIEATGSGYGWFAVESRNPLLIAPKRLSEGQRRTLSRGAKQRHRARLRKAARRDVRHTRITLYKPNRAVVVLDRARAVHGSRRYERHLQLSRWAPYSDGNVFAMGAPMPISSRLASGELQVPEVETSAPYFPHKAMLERRHRLTYTSRGKAVDHILVLGIDGGTAYGEIAGGRIGKRATTIILHDRLGRPIEQRVIRREGTRLVVE